jgi:hypothetical protein
MRSAVLLLFERCSRTGQIVGCVQAGVEPPTQVSDQLDRSRVLPAKPPLAVHDVCGNADRLECAPDIGGQRVEQIVYGDG